MPLDTATAAGKSFELSDDFPMKSGKWTMTYVVDKMTDEASVRAVSVAEGEQARYQSTFVCKPRGARINDRDIR